MMYDHELILLGEVFTQDEWGNQVSVPQRTSVLCKVKSVGRQEFYAAAQTGLKPTLVFEVHAYEYNDERKVEFEDKEYNVVRTYRASFEEMELVCEGVIANRHASNS